MNSLEERLKKAKSLCAGSLNYYVRFCRVYSFTTENISGYMPYFDFKDKSLLTVGSSGDQILNAYLNGARDITLFDINDFAKYYINLKIAAIICLDYSEFQNFLFRRKDDGFLNLNIFNVDSYNKIKSVLKSIDYEASLFFEELFHSYKKEFIREYLFDDDVSNSKIIRSYNEYLKDEESYNKLKKVIKDISFKYIHGNLFIDKIDGKYDNIILSNLCTVSTLDSLVALVNKLDKNNLSENGSMLIAYLWQTNFNSDYYAKEWKEIYKMPVVKEKLKEFITEHHQFEGYSERMYGGCDDDLALIYRKK